MLWLMLMIACIQEEAAPTVSVALTFVDLDQSCLWEETLERPALFWDDAADAGGTAVPRTWSTLADDCVRFPVSHQFGGPADDPWFASCEEVDGCCEVAAMAELERCPG